MVHYQPGIHSPKLNSTFTNNYTSTRDFNEIVYVLNILNENRVLATNKRDSLAMLNLRYQGGRGTNNNIMHGVFFANLINN